MSKRLLSGINVTGTATLNTVANAGLDTDKFLVLDAAGNVDFRTGDELKADIGADVVSRIEHEVKLGETMTIGTPVYVGVDLNAGTNMTVYKATNATEAGSSKTLGLIASSGITNDLVEVVTEGLLAGLNTSTATKGDPVWLGVNGALIFGLANKPVAPAHLVFLGIVTRVQSNNGEIFVKVQNGFEMNEIHNYLEGSVQNNEVIVYESATSLYKPKSIPTILGYTPVPDSRTITINGTTYDLSANRSWTISANLNARTEYEFTTDGTTNTYSAVYSVGQVDVFYNGSKLSSTEFTASNGTSVTLGFTPPSGQLVEVVAWETGGGVASGRTLTINGTTYDLSANRTWTLTTTNISEGTNLYFTNARAQSAVSGIYLPLSGGTLTGALNGTSATFSGNITGGKDITLTNVGIAASNILATSASGLLSLTAGATSGYTGGGTIELVANDRSGTNTRGEIYISAGNASSNTANGFISMLTANTERVRITYGGDLCVGVTSSIWSSGGRGVVHLNGSNSAIYGLTIGGNNAGYLFHNGTDLILNNNLSQSLTLGTNGIERMRITSGGRLLVGTTSVISTNYSVQSSGLAGFVTNGTNAGDANYYSVSTTIGWHFYAESSGTKFYVLNNGDVRNANNSYGAISDISLKENIVDASPKLADLLKVKIRNYNLIADENKEKQLGVIAQELEEIFPNMISEDKQMGSDERIKTVKYSVFVPMLIKAIQEQQAQIEELKALIAAK